MCAGSRLKLSIVKESFIVASLLESCIELFTVGKSCLQGEKSYRVVSRKFMYKAVSRLQ